MMNQWRNRVDCDGRESVLIGLLFVYVGVWNSESLVVKCRVSSVECRV